MVEALYGARIAALIGVLASDGVARLGLGIDALSLLSDIKELNRQALGGEVILPTYLWSQGTVVFGNPRLWSVTLGGAFGFGHEAKILIGPSFSNRASGSVYALKVGTTYEFSLNEKWMVAPSFAAEFSRAGSKVLAGITFFPHFKPHIVRSSLEKNSENNKTTTDSL